MSTTMVSYKEFTIASIDTVIECHMVIIIIPVKGQVKFVEEESVAFLGVTFGFLALSDQSVIHYLSPFGNVPFASFEIFKAANGLEIKKARK
jgi:hypothetical protein